MVPFFKQFRNLSLFSVMVGVMALGIYARAADMPTSSGAPTLTAKLVDPEKKAAKQAATVEVTITGIQMTDPGLVAEKPAPGQGHLHYQVDTGFVVATTATKLSFHGLTPGSHTITVSLAANDHSPLGPKQVLTVTVPSEKPAAAAPISKPAPVPAPAPKSGGY